MDVITQSLAFREADENRQQRKKCNLLITPYLEDMKVMDFDKVAKLIERGEDAARLILPQIRQLADSLSKFPLPQRKSFTFRDSILITKSSIDGLKGTTYNLVDSRLRLKLPQVLTADQLEKAIDRVYSTTFYETVSYRIAPDSVGNRLDVKVTEKKSDLLRIGFHYDSDEKAAALLNGTFFNLGSRGSLTTVDVKLGNTELYDVTHFLLSGYRPRVGIRFEAQHARSTLVSYNANGDWEHLRVRNTTATFHAGSIFSTTTLAGVGMKRVYFDATRLNPLPDPTTKHRDDYFAYNAVLMFDTRDRSVFPSSGLLVYGNSDYSSKALGCRREFITREIMGTFYFPFPEHITVASGFDVGNDTGPDRPISATHSIGGIDDFMGMEKEYRSGTAKQTAMIAAQWEFYKRRFVVVRFNAGNVFDSWSWDLSPNRFETGYGVTAGILTFVGPVQVTYHSGSAQSSLFHFRFGYMF